jgi:hypothetical protein
LLSDLGKVVLLVTLLIKVDILAAVYQIMGGLLRADARLYRMLIDLGDLQFLFVGMIAGRSVDSECGFELLERGVSRLNCVCGP